MTWIDPPTSYRLTVRDIPPPVFSDFRDVCKKRGLPVNEAIIRLMELYAKTGGKALDRPPVR